MNPQPCLRAFLAVIAIFLLGGCNAYPGRSPALLADVAPAEAIAATTAGPVEGRTTPKGRAFLGIPYAAAPVGALRWKPPLPIDPWVQPRRAVEVGPTCVQAIGPSTLTGGGGGFITGSEDCLYLNVYTPPDDRRRPGGWPVLVFIHGGAFVLGAGDNYDPSPLVMSQEMIAVTFNYRLGPFGFLAHPALAAESPAGGSGNFALLDQQAALRWVHENAAAFGGDAKRVTVAGESAGAWSVCQHLLSPASKGLFARAILQSGSCTERLSLAPSAQADEDGRSYARQLGCTDPGDPGAVQCLRQLSTAKIARAPSTRKGINGAGSWGPV